MILVYSGDSFWWFWWIKVSFYCIPPLSYVRLTPFIRPPFTFPHFVPCRTWMPSVWKVSRIISSVMMMMMVPSLVGCSISFLLLQLFPIFSSCLPRLPLADLFILLKKFYFLQSARRGLFQLDFMSRGASRGTQKPVKVWYLCHKCKLQIMHIFSDRK